MRVNLKLGPVARISLGLVSLAACLLLTADLIFGLMPDQTSVARQIRKRASESLAIQLTALAQSENFETMRRTLHAVISRDPDVQSIAVRRADGVVMAETGSHDRYWEPPARGRSTVTHVLVPINGPTGVWGQVEVSYKPLTPQTLVGWLKLPSVALTLTMMTLGLLVYYLYLRRILKHLDPNAAIPDRVRTAFDALSEGVLVVDHKGQVLLANAAFRGLHPEAGRELTGKKIGDLAWLSQAVGNHEAAHPWNRAIAQKATVAGETIRIAREGGEPLKVTINCAPILDDSQKVRGCLITFDDLSMVEHMNQALLDSVAKLEVAKKQIEQQNEELKRLANHDQLTGALTRRAFLERGQQIFLKSLAQRGNVCCVMADIDHFKSINDRFGHLVGDQVIQFATQTLESLLRPNDLVCRYGGEEFCLLLPGVDSTGAQKLAELMRQQFEASCGAAVIPREPARITCSFGVTSLDFGGQSLADLIKQADHALYSAKAEGRNRVVRFDEATSVLQTASRAAA
jgi:diguanylate cyclase (GGDEF)-like protein/PAS domain S-box-containing protein